MMTVGIIRIPFDDAQHIVYVNGENQNSATELGKLMHDFSCTNPDDKALLLKVVKELRCF